MIPLPDKPKIVILVDDGSFPLLTATNISPEVEVVLVKYGKDDNRDFNDKSAGLPFRF